MTRSPEAPSTPPVPLLPGLEHLHYSEVTDSGFGVGSTGHLVRRFADYAVWLATTPPTLEDEDTRGTHVCPLLGPGGLELWHHDVGEIDAGDADLPRAPTVWDALVATARRYRFLAATQPRWSTQPDGRISLRLVVQPREGFATPIQRTGHTFDEAVEAAIRATDAVYRRHDATEAFATLFGPTQDTRDAAGQTRPPIALSAP